MYKQIYSAVRDIPYGRVTTYGQIAAIVGIRSARIVGYAMSHAPVDTPWHRVVNSKGKISVRRGMGICSEQRLRMEEEGIEFDSSDRIDFERFGWLGPGFV